MQSKACRTLADFISAEIAFKIWIFYERRISNRRIRKLNAVRLREMKANGASVKEICGELGISRASVYRLLEASS